MSWAFRVYMAMNIVFAVVFLFSGMFIQKDGAAFVNSLEHYGMLGEFGFIMLLVFFTLSVALQFRIVIHRGPINNIMAAVFFFLLLVLFCLLVPFGVVGRFVSLNFYTKMAMTLVTWPHFFWVYYFVVYPLQTQKLEEQISQAPN